MLLRNIKKVLIKILFKEGDDINHLLFLHNKKQLNKLVTMGQLSSGLMHDLFTPISSLLLIVDHLEKTGALDDNELKLSLSSSKKELREFTNMIHAFLKEDEKTEKINISDLVEQSIRLLSHRATEGGVRVYFLRNSNIEITTNKLRLFQSLINIISNAINSHEKSIDNKNVTINISERRDCIEIEFTDNGSGIPKELLKDIYSPLFTTREKGIGLGLSTTKKIIEKELGGNIKIKSRKNIGTSVFIKLPIYIDF